MRGTYMLLSLGLLLAPALQAQNREADSLRRLLQAQPQLDTTRVRRLQELSYVTAGPDLPQALLAAQQGQALAQKLSDVTGEGKALLWLSTLMRRQTKYEEARRYAQQAQQLYIHHADKLGQSKAYLQLSLIDMVQGNFTAAITAGLQGVPLAEQAGDLQTQARLQATLGTLYSHLGDYAAALPVLQAALRNGEKLHDPQVTLNVCAELGNLYQDQKNWRMAIRYYQRTNQLARQQQDHLSETINEVNLANAYRKQGNHAQALTHSLRARSLARTTQDAYSLPNAELSLATSYLQANRLDSALALAQHSLQLSQKTHGMEAIRDASDLLAQGYASRGDYAAAYRYQHLNLAYNDTLAGEETQRRTSALRYGYELDKKQAQIALLTKTRQLQEQQSSRQRQQLYALLAGLGSVVLVAVLLWRNVMLKQRANKRLNEKNDQIAHQRDDLNRTLTELKTTQNQLIQREKMASLGELTAGVAHEIQNPLNFVNNFAEVSLELAEELAEELAQEKLSLGGQQTITALLHDLTQNQQKIHQHGQRADGIVKSMLAHSRIGSGERQLLDLNTLAQEAWHLAYQVARTKDSTFEATLRLAPDPAVGLVNGVAADLNQVLINVFANACYAMAEKKKQLGASYQPEVLLSTHNSGEHAEIRVRDNGIGIPAAAHEKIFQPFFTTKPPGEGTGLGLSLSYDIITKGHGGTLTVLSEEGQFTEITCTLPQQKITTSGASALRKTTSAGELPR